MTRKRIEIRLTLLTVMNAGSKYEDRDRKSLIMFKTLIINPYPTAFPYGNSMVLHFYQQQGSSTTKTVHKVINKGFKAYV